MKRIVLLILVAIAAFMFSSYGQGLNIIDAGNSTVKNLDSAGVFTGKPKDLILGGNWSTVSIFLAADHSSTLNGVKVYFGTDSTKWKDSITTTVTANVCTTLYCPVYTRYYKVKYTNGTTATTNFIITSILHEQNIQTTIPSDSLYSKNSLILQELNNHAKILDSLRVSGDSLKERSSLILNQANNNGVKVDTTNAKSVLLLQELSKNSQRLMALKLDSLGSTTTDTVKYFWFNSGAYNTYIDGFITLMDSAAIADTFYVQRYDTLNPYNNWTSSQIAYVDMSTIQPYGGITGQYGNAGGYVILPGTGLTKTFYIAEPYPRQYRVWVSKYAVRTGRHIFIRWTQKQR